MEGFSLAFSFLVAGCLFYGLYLRSTARRLPLPPGPKTSWFGSVELPKTYPWKTYAEWRQNYGNLIYIYIFGNPILILNSAKVASDLLDKRSSIYSSRPQRTMVTKLMGWDWLFSTLPYGTWWRRHRTLFHQYLNVNTTSDYHPIQLKETFVMLRNLIETPENMPHHIRRTAAAIVMQMMYGHQVAREGDSYVTLADKALATLGHSGIFGTYLVDYIPMLRHVPTWMPGAGFKRRAFEWRKLNQAMLNVPFEQVKENVARGTAVPCIVATELEQWFQSGQDPEHETLVKDVAATTYAAGSDTTVSAILSFFLAATVYPDFYKNAQAEIDRVIGTQRLPNFGDRHSLPYVDWIVWECLRWNPVTPLGIAHSITENDVYEGYLIPEGTTVLPNVWAILHDETIYPDPFAFRPERYADAEKNAALGINEPPFAAFGFGRRSCPGQWLAVDSMWIAVATIAAALDITKALDESGKPIEPDVRYDSSMLSRPEPFQCRIMPRSAEAAALVEQAADEL
ncbi:cytochrome P450 [Laetiporus sulphureus 93-53]|uniref:Cytochrome P450 n=1 Tax=Laetiporus sulphureus 93-53 TaxID=1314785 RepID=A0A165DZL8_9APHY|nr:cytochrome P450 [Laetiporus sulphureus 93-53]KZT05964.1 cytochrome P450 [Laetiporus sulphureus 93-53]